MRQALRETRPKVMARLTELQVCLGMAFLVLCPMKALAEEPPKSQVDEAAATPAAQSQGAAGSRKNVRRFDDVLNDLLNEFSYDLKTSQAPELKMLAVRRVAMNEAIPKSYESYLESMVVERIKRHSKIKILQCPNCRVRKSVVEDGKIHITMPINNATELDQIATQLGIETWLDVALLYQETAMVLALNAFDAKTKELVWTRVYNSEAIYRKKLGLASEESEDEGESPGEADGKEKKEKEKEERYTFSTTVGYHVVPNVKKTSGMMGLNIRMSERFDHGHSEVGAILTPLVDPDLFISSYSNVKGDPTTTGEAKTQESKEAIQPFQVGAGLFAAYNHNFFSGTKENTDEVRFGSMFGVGVIASTGYLSLAVRGGALMKLGRHFVVEGSVLYSAPTTISIRKSVKYKTQGGVGGDISFGLLF